MAEREVGTVMHHYTALRQSHRLLKSWGSSAEVSPADERGQSVYIPVWRQAPGCPSKRRFTFREVVLYSLQGTQLSTVGL